MRKVISPKIDQRVWLRRDDGRLYRAVIIAIETCPHGTVASVGFWNDISGREPKADVDSVDLSSGLLFCRQKGITDRTNA